MKKKIEKIDNKKDMLYTLINKKNNKITIIIKKK
jgi:hypothetical protein